MAEENVDSKDVWGWYVESGGTERKLKGGELYVRIMCWELDTWESNFSDSALVGSGMEEAKEVREEEVDIAEGAAAADLLLAKTGAVTTGRTDEAAASTLFIACRIFSCLSRSRWRTRRNDCSCFVREDEEAEAVAKSPPFLRGSTKE